MIFLKTFEEASDMDYTLTRSDFRDLASDNRQCSQCGQHVWRWANTGLCFTCTTGESDDSDEIEVGEPYDCL